MEEFVPMMSNENGGARGGFLYASSPVLGPPSREPAGFGGRGNSSGGGNNNGHDNNSNRHCPLGMAGAFHLQPATATEAVAHPALKTKGRHQHHHQDHDQAEKFCYSQVRDVAGGRQGTGEGLSDVEAMKAKIIAHPQYPGLLDAYMNCQKIGAPLEVVKRLSFARRDFESRQGRSGTSVEASSMDPELDQFMEAYYDMLVKYKEELTTPLQEAMEFLRKFETQYNSLCSNGPICIFPSGSDADDKCQGVGSLEDEQQVNSGGETDQMSEINPPMEEQELKNELLRKYSGYLSSLKQELSKKTKKGKLPKEARQKLLGWWELHYKWPYPSESEKVELAEVTGLNLKQINNWFINQRKRHWKPSEDMEFMVMDGLHSQAAALYVDGNYIFDGRDLLGRDLQGGCATK